MMRIGDTARLSGVSANKHKLMLARVPAVGARLTEFSPARQRA